MEYEKKYNEALERARDFHDGPTANVVTRTFLEQVFPELRESKDERIRKWLLECVENLSDGNFIEVSKQDVLFYLEKQKEQKPAEWSEEDERMLKSVIWHLRYSVNNGDIEHTAGQLEFWLKSIRPQQKAELTLLDENIIKAAVAFVEQNDHFNCWRGIDKHTVIKALRSLKPHWKPSEEQMKALNAMNCYGELSYQGQQQLLIDLYQQLKKLM